MGSAGVTDFITPIKPYYCFLIRRIAKNMAAPNGNPAGVAANPSEELEKAYALVIRCLVSVSQKKI